MRGDYLYYEEKIDITPEEKDAKAARRYFADVKSIVIHSAHLRVIELARRLTHSPISLHQYDARIVHPSRMD